jgi:UDP-glucose-4-epimerase GalE
LKTVLVTGGAGYIGSHTCKVLAQAGYIPVCYDNLSTGHQEAVKWGPFVQGDIADKKCLDQTIQRFKPLAVFHFAADAAVLESEINPAKYYRTNVEGTLHLLETMIDCGLKRLIFSSSCAVYGEASANLLTEELIPNPINPYGRTKWIAEQMMLDFDRAYGLKTIALRYFNAAGADLEGEIGENHCNETHLVPRAIQTALGRRNELIIFGDGTSERDYTHVADLARAHVQSLDYLLRNNQSDCFNLGTGRGTTILEILRAVQAVSNCSLPIRFEKKKEADPHRLIANIAKAKKRLGWEPLNSKLNILVESAYNWHSKNDLDLK